MANPPQIPHHNHNRKTLFPKLPDDVGQKCLEHLPTFEHNNVKLTNKHWRETLKSPTFHPPCRESFIYVYLRTCIPKDRFLTHSFNWYALNLSTHNLFQIEPCAQLAGASFVSLGHFLYMIGGWSVNSVDVIPSPDMWVYDCSKKKWEKGPPMSVGRKFAASGVIDRKIYVLGGTSVVDRWAEVFDPNTRSWAKVNSPTEVSKQSSFDSAVVVDGSMYALAAYNGVVFKPRVEGQKWDMVSNLSPKLDTAFTGRPSVLDGVLYSHDYLRGKIIGFDFGRNMWRDLRGVENSLPKYLPGHNMASVDGRLFVMWKEENGGDMKVLCAEILVRKTESGELWGSVMWSRVVTVIAACSEIMHCLEVYS